jgi:sporulation protein YlmC with PRC-barrel domain
VASVDEAHDSDQVSFQLDASAAWCGKLLQGDETMNMRKAAITLATGALTLSFAGAAIAQEGAAPGASEHAQEQQGAAQPGAQAEAGAFERSQPLAQLGADHIKVGDLTGMDVQNRAGDDVGSVDDIILDREGRVAAVVIGTGGFLGLGEKVVAVPWEQVEVTRDPDDADSYRIQVPDSEDELENLPEFDPDTRAAN